MTEIPAQPIFALAYLLFGFVYGFYLVNKAKRKSRTRETTQEEIHIATEMPAFTVVFIGLIWPLTLTGQLIGKLKS